ncbi:MAG: SAM-dependent DNA methyltransferase [Planctomycetes bacterium]|nr:SAM-dependent DNA methyltransferase [Planctomycetota bacterium]
MQFKNQKHERIFRQVIHGLQGLGYKGGLIQEGYRFPDLFLPEAPVRLLPAAAFGREPPSYDTACPAIVIPDHKGGVELVSECRALGAPVALEVADDRITQWKVTAETDRIAKQDEFNPDILPQKLKERRREWLPDTIVRGKNVFAKLAPRQLDFIDLGLIPALERQVKDKLDRLLREVIRSAVSVHKNSTGQDPDMQRLFRLVFRFVAARLLSDRQVPSFRLVDGNSDPETVLARVSRYYSQTEPVIEDAQTIMAVAGAIWGGVSFQNLSVQALADIYENTLVDEQIGRKLGTHSTPASVARYVVSRLITEESVPEIPHIVEPCSGHAIFLVAARERLRDLLPSRLDPQERHRLFVRALQGFERDPVALEIGKLCLMLADFPFPDGWRLLPADVFASPEFESALARADIVLGNPPFGGFSEDERRYYPGLRALQKPAELLLRVLDRLKPSATLGFVLPRQFTDGRAYRDIRRLLADRYEYLEVVSLPDRIFHVSQIETSLLIGRMPSTRHAQVNLSFSHVSEADADRFLQDYAVSYKDSGSKTKAAFAASATIPPLAEVWERLTDSPKLVDVAEVHLAVVGLDDRDAVGGAERSYCECVHFRP